MHLPWTRKNAYCLSANLKQVSVSEHIKVIKRCLKEAYFSLVHQLLRSWLYQALWELVSDFIADTCWSSCGNEIGLIRPHSDPGTNNSHWPCTKGSQINSTELSWSASGQLCKDRRLQKVFGLPSIPFLQHSRDILRVVASRSPAQDSQYENNKASSLHWVRVHAEYGHLMEHEAYLLY